MLNKTTPGFKASTPSLFQGKLDPDQTHDPRGVASSLSGPGSTSSTQSGPAPPVPPIAEGRFQKLFQAGLPGGGVESLPPPTERARARPVARHVSCGGGGCFPQSPGQDPGRVFLRYCCLALRPGRGTPELQNLPRREPSGRGRALPAGPLRGLHKAPGTVVGVVPPS